MEINKINSNNRKYNSQSFRAGINNVLYTKLEKNGGDYVDIMKKIDEINKINNKHFTIEDAVFNIKEKAAEFFLTAVDKIKFIPGLEDVKPQVVKASGENLAEAFKNISPLELKQANKKLAVDYNNRYEETKSLREELKAARDEYEAKLKYKFEHAEGFWNDFYRQLASRTKQN